MAINGEEEIVLNDGADIRHTVTYKDRSVTLVFTIEAGAFNNVLAVDVSLPSKLERDLPSVCNQAWKSGGVFDTIQSVSDHIQTPVSVTLTTSIKATPARQQQRKKKGYQGKKPWSENQRVRNEKQKVQDAS